VKELFAESLEGQSARMFDETALAPVRQLNAHALDTLRDCARHPAWAGSAWAVALGLDFSTLSSELRAELARSPVCLLEFALSFSGLVAATGFARDRQSPPPFLSLDKAIELSQITLSLAWTFSRLDMDATTIVFGLTAVEAQKIRSLDVRDMPRIAERTCGQLRPRWFARPRIWHELLRHKGATKASSLAPPHLRILQRQLAASWLATGATRSTRRTGA